MRFSALFLLLFLAFSHGYFGNENESLAVFGGASNLQSPRTVAFEGAGSALLSQDFGAALMNPALLSGEGFGAGAVWQSGDLANRQGVLAFSHNFFIGRMQHTYGVEDNGEVWNRDEHGEPTGKASYPIAQYYAITAAFPLKLFRFGITARYLWEQLAGLPDSQTGMGLAMDWGFFWNAGNRHGFALIGRYFGRQVRPFVKGGINGFALASEFAASTFWRSSQNVTWLFELAVPRYAPIAGKLGLEYRLSEPILLRAGLQRNLIDVARYARYAFSSGEETPIAGYYRFFSLGAGYKVWNIALDYSFSLLIEGSGSEHRIGLSGNF
ncbi:MAG: hypothetical protein LBH25_10520 [Fibromonadaceae bacterium]|nr:hypothetical protein [Fibromonadaceae bacterium]